VADKDLLELKKTAQFRKDLKRMVKRRVDVGLLDEIIQTQICFNESTAGAVPFPTTPMVSIKRSWALFVFTLNP